jgi:hypothetical protein
VMAGLKAMGYDPSRVKVLIHQFVTLTEGKEKVKMSTRKANFVTLDELMDEVGLDVTRYFFINRSMSSHLNFDLTLAKTQSDENPVYYVQYAHARISSILRKAKEEGIDAEAAPDLSLLREPAETDLARVLLSYPRVVAEAARNFEPHKVPTYLEEAATVYHHFQHAGKQDENLRVVSKKNVPAAPRGPCSPTGSACWAFRRRKACERTGRKDSAARCAGSSYYIYELLKTSSGVSQVTWMMDAARCAGSSYFISKVLKTSGGESNPSERPEAQSPIIQKNWNQNIQASGRPIEPARASSPGPATLHRNEEKQP